jgi:hypothetical protein
LVLEVDFNNMDSADRVVASVRYSSQLRPPDLGEWVRLNDPEGNSCIGKIEELRNLVVAVRPDWTTWQSVVVIHRYWNWSAELTSYDAPPTALEPAERRVA